MVEVRSKIAKINQYTDMAEISRLIDDRDAINYFYVCFDESIKEINDPKINEMVLFCACLVQKIYDRRSWALYPVVLGPINGKFVFIGDMVGAYSVRVTRKTFNDYVNYVAG